MLHRRLQSTFCVPQERDEARKALESASVVAAAIESANGKRSVEDGEAGPSKRVRMQPRPKKCMYSLSILVHKGSEGQWAVL